MENFLVMCFCNLLFWNILLHVLFSFLLKYLLTRRENDHFQLTKPLVPEKVSFGYSSAFFVLSSKYIFCFLLA